MPFCPNCGEEYREGFEVCADCGVRLTDQKPEKAEAENVSPAFLAHASTLEADAIIALLASFGIEARRKVSGEGDISRLYTGVSAFGEDIFVPEDKLGEAEAIISSKNDLPSGFEIENMENEELEDYTPPDENQERRRQLIGFFLMLLWIIPLAVYFFSRFLGNLKGIING